MRACFSLVRSLSAQFAVQLQLTHLADQYFEPFAAAVIACVAVFVGLAVIFLATRPSVIRS